MMKRALRVVMFLSLTVPPAVQAQETSQVRVGDRVRVTSDACPLQGSDSWKVQSLANDTLRVEHGGVEAQCPFVQITRLEVFGPTSVLKTAGFGMLIGAAGGALILGLPTEPCGGDCGCGCRDFAMAVGAVLGAGSGLLVGTIFWDFAQIRPLG